MIRIATMQDLDRIVEIKDNAVNYMHNVDKFIQWTENYPLREDFINDINKSELYVSVDDNSLVINGFFVINKEVYDEYDQANFSVDKTNVYTIHRVCTDVSARGLGLGNLLLTEAISQIRKTNADGIIIDTNENNIAMNKIIKQVGFKFVGTMSLRIGLGSWNCYEYKL